MNLMDTLTSALTGQPAKRTPTLVYEYLAAQDASAAVSKTEAREFAAAKKKWQTGFHGTTVYTEAGARTRYNAQFSDGKDHADVTVRTRGLESLVSENAAKILVCKSAMFAASGEACTVINAVHARVLPAAAKVLAAREKAESEEAAKFNLVCVPSALTGALKQFANSLKGERVAGGKPDDIAAFDF
jgi:tRNA A37 threonylcarbamoyladenosine modification protein TsaB